MNTPTLGPEWKTHVEATGLGGWGLHAVHTSPDLESPVSIQTEWVTDIETDRCQAWAVYLRLPLSVLAGEDAAELLGRARAQLEAQVSRFQKRGAQA